MDFIDVVRAYHHAKARRETHTLNLPEEDHQVKARGKLKKVMYDTRDAA